MHFYPGTPMHLFSGVDNPPQVKLLKLGALVRTSVRRIKFAMASAFPWQDEFAVAHARLRNAAA
jgi:hypothetical protein